MEDKDANGIYNVFRYVFDKPTGDFALITSIDVGESKVVIMTPAVVNDKNLTIFVVETSDLAGKADIYQMELATEGRAEFVKKEGPQRFYRLKVVENN